MAVELHEHERHVARRALAALLAAIAALILALAVLVWVAWQVQAQPKATPFDSDGVRCYRAADQLACLKTAEPPR